MRKLFLILPMLSLAFLSVGCKGYRVTSHGITSGVVKLEVVNDSVIRVCATDSRFYHNENPDIEFAYPKKKFWKVERQDNGTVALVTSKIKACLDPVSGNVTFTDPNGKLFLREKSRCFEPSLMQVWMSGEDETFFGFGHNHDRNSLPVAISTNDYCILWSSVSPVRWGDEREFVQLNELFRVYDEAGAQGGLSGIYVSGSGEKFYRPEPFLYFDNNEANVELLPEFPLDGTRVIFDGALEPYESGQYGFKLHYSGYIEVYFGEKRILPELWQPCDNPSDRLFYCEMEKGVRTPVRIVWTPDGDNAFCSLMAVTPRPFEDKGTIRFWSESGKQIEYYFTAGESMDEAISAYRSLITAKADADSAVDKRVALRWEELYCKIAEGMNSSLTADGHWTLDLSKAGVEKRYTEALKESLLPKGGPVDLTQWHELLTRWYQFGTFCPEFRGLALNDPSFPVQGFEELRSRMIPYIRSVEGLMRPLAMDYGTDPKSLKIEDQYMFGPSLMVCPIYRFAERSRNVYLPENDGGWYDYNTGLFRNGGSVAEIYLPLEKIPLFAPAGAIIPFLYNRQNGSQEVMEINVFSGKDGSFILKEEDASSIEISYSNDSSQLTFSARTGGSSRHAPKEMRIRHYTLYGVRTIVAEYANNELTVAI